jgi:hypothetical protein
LLARPESTALEVVLEIRFSRLSYNFKSLKSFVTAISKMKNEQNNPTSRFRKQRLQRNLGIPGRILKDR